MKYISFFLISSGMISSYVFAHDESLHDKDVEAPRCAAMKNMDHSKMKKDDPIMQAMMKKCMHHNDHDNDHHKKHDSKHTGAENKMEDKHKKHDH